MQVQSTHEIPHAMQGSDEDKAEAAKVLVAVLESVRIVAVLLSPITPSLSTRIYLQLGFTQGQIDAVKASWLHQMKYLFRVCHEQAYDSIANFLFLAVG